MHLHAAIERQFVQLPIDGGTQGDRFQLLEPVGAEPTSAIIDIGGGASRLVDSLLAKGCQNITVLDLSAAALKTQRHGRCGEVECRSTQRSGGRQRRATSGVAAPPSTS